MKNNNIKNNENEQAEKIASDEEVEKITLRLLNKYDTAWKELAQN
jgi:hypothetical protein